MNDLISAVMGVKYTRSETDTLKRSIDSVLNQTYKNIELIICERDSTAEAKALLSSFAAQDDRVILLDGSAAKSFSEQLNMSVERASGDLIARMDDDDYSFPERFKREADYLCSHDDLAFVGCNVRLVQDGNDMGVQIFPERPFVKDFLFTMPFIHPAIMFRKEAFEAIGGYSTLERCNRCEDYDFLLRLYEKGLVGANLQETLFAYTLPAKGKTTRNFKDRVNEMKTRFFRFHALGLMPGAFFYAIKPLAVWLIPSGLLAAMKSARRRRSSRSDT